MQKISILAKDKPLLLFFVLAYGFAWLAWLPLVLSRSGIGILPFDLPLWTTLPGSYAPLAAACIVQWISARNLRIARLLPSPGRALLAFALGWLLIALAFIFLPSIYLTGGAIRSFDWAALVIYAHSGPQALLMAGPIGEEPGWRGFALPKLQARFGPVPAVLLLGVVWALWHAPLFLVPSWGGTSPWVFSILLVGLSLFMGLCFNSSNGSIVVTVLLHAVFNASSPVLGAFLGHASVTKEAYDVEGYGELISVRPETNGEARLYRVSRFLIRAFRIAVAIAIALVAYAWLSSGSSGIGDVPFSELTPNMVLSSLFKAGLALGAVCLFFFLAFGDGPDS